MSESSENALADLGIHLIRTPNPLSKDLSNCYFIDGPVPTLIDSALATEDAYRILASELSRVGRCVRDIERVVLTHGHADHRALAVRICEESGAEVFCHPLENWKVVRLSAEEKAVRHSRTADFFKSAGVPEEHLSRLVEGPTDSFIKPKLDRATFIDDGDMLDLGNMKLRTIHTPGHSCGSLCFREEKHGLLFAGDTLLPTPHITALIEVDMLQQDPHYNPLRLHAESLRTLARLGPSLILPGHGEVFGEYDRIISELLERHRIRRRHILRSLRHGPKTLYEICRSVFLFTSADDLYLALSEITGNIGILVEEGNLTARRETGLTYYEST